MKLNEINKIIRKNLFLIEFSIYVETINASTYIHASTRILILRHYAEVISDCAESYRIRKILK